MSDHIHTGQPKNKGKRKNTRGVLELADIEKASLKVPIQKCSKEGGRRRMGREGGRGKRKKHHLNHQLVVSQDAED